MNKKFCVFCGKKPSKKNKEHIIPRWLIELTGDLNREILVGRDWNNGTLEKRTFRFSSYTLPSCKKCNDDFGILERETKPILIDIMNEKAVSSEAVNKLLDWFDKVRVGLWLSAIVLNKNHNGIIPHYYIQDRVGVADRALLVYKTEEEQEGISFIGTDGPIFHSMPSVFGIKINKYYFVNISTPLLLHEDLGILSKETHEVDSDSEMNIYSFSPGNNRLQTPDFLKKFPNNSMCFIQAVKVANQAENEISLYKSSYASELFCGEKSKILVVKNGQITELSEHDNFELESIKSLLMFSLTLGTKVMNYQEALFEASTKYDQISGSDQSAVEETIASVLEVHKAMKSLYSKQLEQTYKNVLL
ncbi:hypothetical protein [Vibrio cholerae]|uniref:hypothetical protein n=1 Tax=Vibrio cholerae TaxID=666 RepID=UPI000E0A7B8F|nr:hypothetical protein [Vibrio cholerae]